MTALPVGHRGEVFRQYPRLGQMGEDYHPVKPDEMQTLMVSIMQSLEEYRAAGLKPKGISSYNTADEMLLAAELYFKYIADANMDGLRLKTAL